MSTETGWKFYILGIIMPQYNMVWFGFFLLDCSEGTKVKSTRLDLRRLCRKVQKSNSYY